MQGVFAKSSLHKQAWRNPKEGRVGCLHQDIFTRKVTDIAFTSDFCNNYSHCASPASLYLTSPRPRPTRPRVPYLMSSSPSSCISKSQVPTHASQCPRPLVPVPLLYTARSHSLNMYFLKKRMIKIFLLLSGDLCYPSWSQRMDSKVGGQYVCLAASFKCCKDTKDNRGMFIIKFYILVALTMNLWALSIIRSSQMYVKHGWWT